MHWACIVDSLTKQLSKHGLDIVQPFPVQRYNLAVAEQFRLPTFSYAAVNETFLESNGQEERTTLGILVGNTKLLWPCFINYLKANPSHIDNLNPVDSYVATSLEASLDQTLSNLFQSSSSLPKFEIRYYWDKAPKFVAMQRLAHEAGLAYYNTDCFLNIHSEYGPWLALRSAIVVDIAGPPMHPFDPPQNPCPELNPTLSYALKKLIPPNTSYHSSGCNDQSTCARPENLDPDLDDLILQLETETTDEALKWRKWVVMRDISAYWMKDKGKKWRYTQDEIEYFYTKGKQVLSRCIT